MKNFASIASPLECLLKKNAPFLWNDAQQQFHYSKRRSYSCINSCIPRLQVAFYHVHGHFCPRHRCCSHAGRRGKCPHAIAYTGRVLTSAESKYSVTHLEALAVVWALQHFRHNFLLPVNVYMDHITVTQLFHGKNLTRHLARSYLTIQQFEPTLQYLPGKANTVTDALLHNIPVAAVPQIPNFFSSEFHMTQNQDTL